MARSNACRCCCVSIRRSKSTTTSTAGSCRSCCARCWQRKRKTVLQVLRPFRAAAFYEARPGRAFFCLRETSADFSWPGTRRRRTEVPPELPARLRSAQAAGSRSNAPFADLPHQHPYLLHQIVHRARHDCLRGQVGIFEPAHQSVRADKTGSTAKAMQLIAHAFEIVLATKKLQLRQIVFDGL